MVGDYSKPYSCCFRTFLVTKTSHGHHHLSDDQQYLKSEALSQGKRIGERAGNYKREVREWRGGREGGGVEGKLKSIASVHLQLLSEIFTL